MTLNDNKIDYIHWNDPNELMDCLRLLEASGHMLTITKSYLLSKSFEADLIIN